MQINCISLSTVDKMYTSYKSCWDLKELEGQMNYEVSITYDQLVLIKQKTKPNKQTSEQEMIMIFTNIAFIKCIDFGSQVRIQKQTRIILHKIAWTDSEVIFHF